MMQGGGMFSVDTAVERTVERFMYKVYGWMFFGLMVTSAVAYTVFANPVIFMAIFSKPFLMYGLLFGQIGLVIGFTAGLQRLSYPIAALLFVAYSACSGMTLSVLFAVYEIESIYLAMGITSAMFGGMSMFGYLTKADLSGFGSILSMGLFGMMIATFANMFIGSNSLTYALSYVGVVLFTAMTAYDTYKIKQFATVMAEHGENESKIALIGALTLYLDFVNLFIYILRLTGNRKR